MQMPSLKSTLVVTAKLGLAGASIVAIAWMVGVFQPDGTIKESEADILDLNVVHRSDEVRFSDALDEMGHDDPQSFSINGNVVHFSMARHRKRPEQLMKEYQEEFVHEELLSRVYTDQKDIEENHNQYMVDSFTGGPVPQMVHPEYVALGGLMAADGIEDEEDLWGAALDKPKPHDVFKGHRFIEMFWDEHRRESTVTATWSDKNFDYRRMMPGNEEAGQLDVDTRVPACPGCTRINRTSSLDPQGNFASNIYHGARTQEQLLDFYRTAMRKRGWRETDASLTFGQVRPFVDFQGDEANMIQFSRGRDFLTIMAFPDGSGKTAVHTVISD